MLHKFVILYAVMLLPSDKLEVQQVGVYEDMKTCMEASEILQRAGGQLLLAQFKKQRLEVIDVSAGCLPTTFINH